MFNGDQFLLNLMDATGQACGTLLRSRRRFPSAGASHQSRLCGTSRQIAQARKSRDSSYCMVLQQKWRTNLASTLASTWASTLASALASTLASSLASTLATTWASQKPFNSSPPAPHSNDTHHHHAQKWRQWAALSNTRQLHTH